MVSGLTKAEPVGLLVDVGLALDELQLPLQGGDLRGQVGVRKPGPVRLGRLCGRIAHLASEHDEDPGNNEGPHEPGHASAAETGDGQAVERWPRPLRCGLGGRGVR